MKCSDKHFYRQRGSVLITALSVIIILGIVSGTLYFHARGELTGWKRQSDWNQAFYLAESGLAIGVYNFSTQTDRDTSSLDSLFAKAGTAWGDADSLAFQLSDLQMPEVEITESSYLEILSKGAHNKTNLSIYAKLGMDLDERLFGPALTMLNNQEPTDLAVERINGEIRLQIVPIPLKSKVKQLDSGGVSIKNLTSKLEESNYYQQLEEYRQKMSQSGGRSGSVTWSPENPPDFKNNPEIVYILGRVEFNSNEPWTIKGPGKVYAHEEIMVSGNIKMENITLMTAGDILFDGDVQASNIKCFSQGGIRLKDKVHIDGDLTAVDNIYLENQSATSVQSVLYVTGKTSKTDPKEKPEQSSLTGIRLMHEANAGGFLIAPESNSFVDLASSMATVRGVIISNESNIQGRVFGSVLTNALRCGKGSGDICMAEGIIDREQMPAQLVQPLSLFSGTRNQSEFRLLQWKLLDG